MRDEAQGLIAKAQGALEEGNLEEAEKLSAEAEAQIGTADQQDAAAAKIKKLTTSLDAESPRPLTLTLEEQTRTTAEQSAQMNKRKSNYRPATWIKGLPAAAQPREILSLAGEDVQDEARVYSTAFLNWMTGGWKSDAEWQINADPMFVKAMSEGTDSAGGYYVPDEYIDRDIHDPGAPGAVLRPHCTQIRVSGKAGYIPGFGDVTWAAMTEGTAPSAVTPTISQYSFTVEKSGAIIQVSNELLADAQSNIPALITSAARESSGRYLDLNILNGTGHWGGVLQSGSIGNYTAANAASIVALDITGTLFNLDSQWRGNAVWVSRSGVAAAIAGIGSTSAGLHAIPALTASPNDSLLGRPYLQSDISGNGLDNSVATANVTLLVGDFKQVYLVERAGFTVSRNESVYWASDQTGFQVTFRAGSALGIATAFSKMTQA
jgi:HK97 family phage major capsid protein